MEIAWLRSFCTLAETLHFGRASVQLHLSQSALSVQIRNLEQSLGTKLFARDRRTVSLTRAGKSFHNDARRLLQDLLLAKRAAQCAEDGETGNLRIGFVNSATFDVLPPVIHYYRLHYPGVELHLRNLPTAEVAGSLLRKEIDVGFLRLPFILKELEIDLLHREPFGCFLHKGHPLHGLQSIAPEQLEHEPFVLYERRQAPGFCDRILKICLDSGFSPAAVQVASEMQTILSLVAAGIGVAILPLSAGSLGMTELKIVPLSGDWPPSETGIAVLRDAREDPLVATFLRVAHQQCGASKLGINT